MTRIHLGVGACSGGAPRRGVPACVCPGSLHPRFFFTFESLSWSSCHQLAAKSGVTAFTVRLRDGYLHGPPPPAIPLYRFPCAFVSLPAG